MKVRRPIRWREGLFLRPHHLQQQDLFVESREHARVRAIENLAWGFLKIQIDEPALGNFLLSVRALHAVFPDGSLVEAPENAVLPSREFGDRIREVGQFLNVAVGLRLVDARGPIVLGKAHGLGDARFTPEEESVYDLDAGADPVPIENLKYNLRLFLGDEPTDGYTTMPLTRLQLTGQVGTPIRLDPTFAPPSLVIAASPVLHGATSAVVHHATMHLDKLGQSRGGVDAGPLILYFGISGTTAVLRDFAQDGMVHPRRAYQEMARLVGGLLFQDNLGRSIDVIPEYDHHRPGPVFEELRRLIDEIGRKEIQDKYHRYPLQRAEGGDHFRTATPPMAKKPGHLFFLEAIADDSAPRVPVLLLGAKISHPGRIQLLRDGALPGVGTERLPGPPPQLPPGQTGQYFRLKHEDSEWGGHLASADQMEVFILGAPTDLKLSLIVVLPEA